MKRTLKLTSLLDKMLLLLLMVTVCVWGEVTNEIYSTKISTSTPSPSTKLPAFCRFGYNVMDGYPTEKQYYQHQTCFWCYQFTAPHRKKEQLELVREMEKLTNGRIMVIKFKAENESHYFDPTDRESWEHVRDSMIDTLEADKLEECCLQAVRCCHRFLHDKQDNNSSQCPRTWDGWSCIPPTSPSTTITIPCPHYAYSGIPECAMTGHKHCTENGTWELNDEGIEWTDYAPCSHQNYHITNYHYEGVAHALSLIALIPAVFIILYYRQLRVQRFFIHLSLFLALLGEALFATFDVWLLRLPEYTKSGSPLDDNSVWCRCIVVGRKLCALAIWSCMLAESIYLHRLIVAAFKGGGKTWVYIVTGWVPAVVLVTSWAISRGILENNQCWLGHNHASPHQLYLITEVPKLAILLVNTLLLINMTRVLLTKLRHMQGGQSSPTRRAVKATAFLLPMFGLQFFLPLYIPPPSTPCHALQVYFFFSMTVDGLQGLYVATVYCYMNKEVQQQIRRSMHQTECMRWWFKDATSAHYEPRTDVSMVSSTAHPPPTQPEEIPLTTRS